MFWLRFFPENLIYLCRPSFDAMFRWTPQVDLPNGIYTVYQKSIWNIFDCNLKKDYQVLVIFGTNIPETIGHKINV